LNFTGHAFGEGTTTFLEPSRFVCVETTHFLCHGGGGVCAESVAFDVTLCEETS